MAKDSLIAKLEEAVKSGTSERRVEMLRQVTDLFLGEAERLTEKQVAVFDDVLLHLTRRIETHALVQLSSGLAPVDNAPIEVVRRLSRHDEIAVAGPMLRQSKRLTDADLIDIARSKSQGHLLAMSERSSLQESVTDVLIERGNNQVHHALAGNAGALFSQAGYASLVSKSEGDEGLMEKLGLRLDMPLEVLRQLLLRATDRVRARLLAGAPPSRQQAVQSALAAIANQLVREASGPRDFSAAENRVDTLNRNGKLNEAALKGFIDKSQYEDMIATLALFCGCKCELIEKMLKNVNHSAVVVVGRAANLSWPTVLLMLGQHFNPPSLTDVDELKDEFLELSRAVAQRSLRFMQVQNVVKNSA